LIESSLVSHFLAITYYAPLKQIERNRQAKIHLIGSYVEENYAVRFDLQSPEWVLDWKVTGQLSEGNDTFSTSAINQDPFTPSSSWAFTLILTFSHQGRRNFESSLRDLVF